MEKFSPVKCFGSISFASHTDLKSQCNMANFDKLKLFAPDERVQHKAYNPLVIYYDLLSLKLLSRKSLNGLNTCLANNKTKGRKIDIFKEIQWIKPNLYRLLQLLNYGVC